jgi:hypothetical protein
LSGTLCTGGSWSIEVGPEINQGNEQITPCLIPYTQSELDAITANGLILTVGSESCGSTCVSTTQSPPTTTTTTTLAPTTTTTTTLAPTTTTESACVYYISNGVSNTDGHCLEEYIASSARYSNPNLQFDCEVSSLLNKFLYTNSNLSGVFDGGGLYYFISNTNGDNNQTLLGVQNFYFVIKVESDGFVSSVINQDCNSNGPIE